MDYYLIGFIALACMIIVGGTYQVYNIKQAPAAILFFIGSLTLFIIYGIRWFGSNPMFTPASGPWPPVINTCPDYLTHIQRTVGGIKKDSCIDTIGVSKDNSLLSTFPKDGTIPENDSYYIDISGLSSDPTTKSRQMCNAAMAQKVTWEGVTNGESCVTRSTGKAGSKTDGSGGAAGCPAV
jgi:hypothetical protein